MKRTRLTFIFATSMLIAVSAYAQTSAFTFQGKLEENSIPANGNYDMQFRLFDTASPGTGNQVGDTISNSAVVVMHGVFTSELDFGANAFPGTPRYIEVAVRRAGTSDAFTTLSPRQPVTPTPYSLHSLSADTANSATNATNATHATTATNADHATTASNADNATNATNADHATTASNADNATNAANANHAATATNAAELGGIAASQYVQSNDARLSDARAPTAGSTNYIQNTTTQEAANFNISGNGIVGGNIGIGTTAPAARLDIINPSGLAGLFTNNASTGKVLSANVNSAEVMNADQNGVHAGPGMTGTPFAYASYDSAGNKLAGSPNISCMWNGGASPARWDCTLFENGVAVPYSTSTHVVVVTAQFTLSPRIPVTNYIAAGNLIGVRLFDTAGNSIQQDFSIVVFKP